NVVALSCAMVDDGLMDESSLARQLRETSNLRLCVDQLENTLADRNAKLEVPFGFEKDLAAANKKTESLQRKVDSLRADCKNDQEAIKKLWKEYEGVKVAV
ncbi:hypothetical protein A2U01_0058985, partial [Trifolium medium]|nr:hypothetical protein [Trifolium medium]